MTTWTTPDGWEVDTDDRTTFYGSTDIAGILGVSRYKSPADVYLEKREKIERAAGDRARWGLLLEDAICQGYAEMTGYRLRRVTELIVERDVPIVFHPDRFIVGERGLFDAKATEVRSAYGEPGTDEVPKSVEVQMVGYLGASGRAWAEVGVLAGSTRGLDIYHLAPNPELFEAMLEAARDFHRDHVLAGVFPPADGSEGWGRLADTFGDSGEAMAPPTAEQALLVDALAQAHREKVAADALWEQAVQSIQDVMRERSSWPTRYGTITWRRRGPSVRWKAVAEAAVAGDAGRLARLVEADKEGREGSRPFLHPF